MIRERGIAVLMNVALIVCCSGCGVKGDPLPPLEPTNIGRGGPSYRRAMQELAEPVSDIDGVDRKKKKPNHKEP